MRYVTGTGYTGEYDDGKITGYGQAVYTDGCCSIAYRGNWTGGLCHLNPLFPWFACKCCLCFCGNFCTWAVCPYDPIRAQEDINMRVARRCVPVL